MLTLTKKALETAAKVTIHTLDFSMDVIERLSNPEDTLVKTGSTINKTISGTLIVTGLGVSTVSLKVGAGLVIAGTISLTSHLLYMNSIKK